LSPDIVAERVLAEHAAESAGSNGSKDVVSAKAASAIAYLQQKLERDATDDPEEIRKAEADVDELIQNLNRNRIDSGERPIFP